MGEQSPEASGGIARGGASSAGESEVARLQRELDAALSRERAMAERLDVLPECVVRVGDDGRILDANRRTLELLERGRDEVVGKPLKVLYAPECWPRLGEVMVDWRLTGGLCDQELVLIAKSGRRRTVRASAGAVAPGAEGGREFVLVLNDVTDWRRAEAALREISLRHEAILSESPDIITEVNAGKVYTWVNRAGREFFGDGVVGSEAAEFFEGAQDTYGTVDPLFAGDESVFYVESWQRRRDGEKRLLGWWCRALKDEHGRVTGALSTARDITTQRGDGGEREKLAGELQDALAKVEALRGLLPICSKCEKIRDDQGCWRRVETYLRDRPAASSTRGLCPDCARDSTVESDAAAGGGGVS